MFLLHEMSCVSGSVFVCVPGETSQQSEVAGARELRDTGDFSKPAQPRGEDQVSLRRAASEDAASSECTRLHNMDRACACYTRHMDENHVSLLAKMFWFMNKSCVSSFVIEYSNLYFL